MIEYLSDIKFAQKEWFFLFALIPALIYWYFFRLNKTESLLNYSSLHKVKFTSTNLKVKLRYLPIILRLVGLCFLIVAMARPQSQKQLRSNTGEGIDIALSIDVSWSMLARDFEPNRLEVAKEVAKDFVDACPNDRIAIVTFGGEAFTQCPLTTDHGIVKNILTDMRAGSMGYGTAIGMGLAHAVGRVNDSLVKSKVIILLSDGVNNVGEISPLTAGETAKAEGVRVYTIGVGKRGKALTPVNIVGNGEVIEYDYIDTDVDEATLAQIAESTGGKYFRATNKESLKQIYNEIDKLEKSKFAAFKISKPVEKFFWFGICALICLLLEFILKYTWLRTVN